LEKPVCGSDHAIRDGVFVSDVEENIGVPQNSSYLFKPTTCDLPTREINEVVALLPTARHFLFVGDSVVRGAFCSLVWPQIHGSVIGSACDYITDHDIYYSTAVKRSHRSTTKVFKDRNITFTQVFANSEFDVLIAGLKNITEPPTHIVFNMGLWIASLPTDQVAAIYKSFLSFVLEQWPQTEHLVFRTTSFVAHATLDLSNRKTMCTNEAENLSYYPYAHLVAKTIYEVAVDWNEKVYRKMVQSMLRVSVIDALAITRNIPQSTSDGRHWSLERSLEKCGSCKQRPLIGTAEKALLNWLYDDWVQQRITNFIPS
jgi:hypothetical protein